MAYIVSGAFWGNTNYFLVSLFGFVTSILFARLFTKEAFGTYQYILSITGLITSTTLTGMNAAVNRAVSRGFEGELRRTTKYQNHPWHHSNDHSSLRRYLVFPARQRDNFRSVYLGRTFLADCECSQHVGGVLSVARNFFRIGTYFGLCNTLCFRYTGPLAFLYFTHNVIWVAFGNFFFGFLGNLIIYHIIVKKIPPNDKLEPGYGCLRQSSDRDVYSGNHIFTIGRFARLSFRRSGGACRVHFRYAFT